MRRSSKPLPKDPNQLAAAIVQLSTDKITPQNRSKTTWLALDVREALKVAMLAPKSYPQNGEKQ